MSCSKVEMSPRIGKMAALVNLYLKKKNDTNPF